MTRQRQSVGETLYYGRTGIGNVDIKKETGRCYAVVMDEIRPSFKTSAAGRITGARWRQSGIGKVEVGQEMVRVVVLSLITFTLAYGLYVFPAFALQSLFRGTDIFSPLALGPTALVFLLLRLYLATSITNRALKAFVFYGMGIGFVSLMILSALLLVKWLWELDGVLVGQAALAAIAGVTAYSIFNANRLVIRRLELDSAKLGGVRKFAFISDVHIGSNPPDHLAGICHRIEELDIEALFIGGDLFDSSDFTLEDVRALKTLNRDVYFITGNHEGYVSGYETLLERFPDLNITVMENEAVDLQGINLIGVADQQSPAARASAVDALHQPDRFNIALVHQPSIWRRTAEDVDLMLCGHTHNGQIFPFNLLVKLQFRHVYGLFADGTSALYVSSGVGCWGPRMRLGSRNEIVVLELRPA